MKNYLNTHKIFYAIVFATAFALIGYFAPRAYYEAADAREFYHVESPLSVDKESYLACEEVVLSGKVYSSVAVEALSQRELVLVDLYTEETIGSIEEQVNLNTTPEGGVFFKRRVRLPCDVGGGTYFFRGRVDFEIRNTTKHTEYYTETFQVE